MFGSVGKWRIRRTDCNKPRRNSMRRQSRRSSRNESPAIPNMSKNSLQERRVLLRLDALLWLCPPLLPITWAQWDAYSYIRVFDGSQKCWGQAEGYRGSHAGWYEGGASGWQKSLQNISRKSIEILITFSKI